MTEPAETPTWRGWVERFHHWRHTNPKTEAVVFFMGGFCFDLLMLHRIDSVPMLIHQGSYLVLLAIALVLDHRLTLRPATDDQGHAAGARPPPAWLAKLIDIRHGLIHFLFGTLLNAYVVFYFRAAAGLTGFVFLALIAAVLVANELPRFRQLGPVMRYALWSFSLTSFLAYLLPTLDGEIAPWHFYTACAVSAALGVGLWWLAVRFTRDASWSFARGAAPGLGVQVALLLLYALHVVPPVPLSTRALRIAFDVERKGQDVLVTHRTSPWLFWRSGDEVFAAREGDRIHVFARVFAPRDFRDRLFVHFERDDERRGWTTTDRIALTITGGERDWRAYAYKKNYQPGDWRVTVETDDGRAVGTLDFRVERDPSTGERPTYVRVE